MPHILHTKDVGSITVYGDAVNGGYDGTKAQLYSVINGIVDGAMLLDVGDRNIVLSAANWDNGEYDLTSLFPSNRYMILTIGIDGDTASGTEINEWHAAEAYVGDGNILHANGTKPTDDIHVAVTYQSLVAEVVVPTQSGTLTYTGQAQSATWNNYDTAAMTISGQTSATDAGTYTAIFTLNSGYKWTDGTRGAKSVTWTIGKANGFISLSANDVSVDDITTTAQVTVISTSGTVTVESADISLATATVSNDIIEISYVDGSTGITQINVSVAANNNYNAASAVIGVYSNYIPIYGAEWAGGSDPTWTRTDDAASFVDPVAAVDNGNGSSPFDSLMPWAGMQIIEDETAGTLVSIPKFYYRWDKSGNKLKLRVSPKAFTNSRISPAHADRGDGQGERDVVYVGRYQCDANFKSVTGATTYTDIRGTFRTGIHNLGSDFWHEDMAMYWTIRMLYLVEYATWNFMSCIGNNYPNSSMLTGTTDGMIYHTGTTASTRTGQGMVQYRHIEYGVKFTQYDGVYFVNYGIYLIKNPANFSDSSGGTLIGNRPSTSNGYISVFNVSSASGFEYALLPNAINGSSTTYTCSYYSYRSAANNFFLASSNSNAGFFYFSGQTTSGTGGTSRVMKLPNAS